MSRIQVWPTARTDFPKERLRTERRSSEGPLREIVTARAVRVGRGHAVEMQLECGHKVLHIGRRDLAVGKVTGCPHCK